MSYGSYWRSATKWSQRRDSHSRGAHCPAVYETAAVATEPRRHEIRGSPRCCPALCGLRDRCIAAMLATLVPVRKDRDTKVELNHRSQACEGPGRHRYSRRVKWSERWVPPPRDPAPEAGASLLGYALINSPAHCTWRPAITSTVRGLCRQTGFNWGKWSSIWVSLPVFRFGRPACISQHLCSVKLESRVRVALTLAVLQTAAWLLGQRDISTQNAKCRV